MKIIVNYDLMERIKDSNEDFNFRILRKRFKKVTHYYPLWFLVSLAINKEIDDSFIVTATSAALYLASTLVADILANKIFGDVERKQAIYDLRKLSILLSKINVKTSYELLQKAESYNINHSIRLDENKLPHIYQAKYIKVPTYDDGNVKDVSILQEHVIGTNKYVLSTGSPIKVYKLAFSASNLH